MGCVQFRMSAGHPSRCLSRVVDVSLELKGEVKNGGRHLAVTGIQLVCQAMRFDDSSKGVSTGGVKRKGGEKRVVQQRRLRRNG